MGVPVAWVLAQSDLSLRLLGGSAGVLREVTLALTTELSEPFRWLSGGELVLTTGIGLPTTRAKRAAYLRGLDECGVSALGFATGLSHEKVPADLIAVADDIGMPLLEVPLATPFAAVVKRMSERLADQHYEAVLRASRAQPRITRAAVSGGASAVVAELGRALSAKVLILAPSGDVIESHPRSLDPRLVDDVRAAVASGGAGAVVAGTVITYQCIKVTRKTYGVLAVVTAAPLSSVDQILLGHANSLLALDFEKPARLLEAHRELNSSVLGLLLSGEHDMGPARAQLAEAADSHGRIRALVIDGGTAPAIEHARTALIPAVERTGSVLFARVHGCQLVAVVRVTTTCRSSAASRAISTAPPENSSGSDSARRCRSIGWKRPSTMPSWPRQPPNAAVSHWNSPHSPVVRCCRSIRRARCSTPSPTPCSHLCARTTATTAPTCWSRCAPSWKPTVIGKPPRQPSACTGTPCANG